jgi:hypothetical protein
MLLSEGQMSDYMGKALSVDLRKRVIERVESRVSGRQPAPALRRKSQKFVT